MQKLLSLGCKIKTLDGLHSKIYCNESHVIIGSSNASSNGLASDEKQFSGNVEANVLIGEGSFVRSVNTWFDDHWKMPSAQPVTTTLISESKPIWLRNSAARRQFTSGLLSHVRQNPTLLGRIKARVVYYPVDGGSERAASTFNLHGRSQYSDAELHFLKGDLPYYDDQVGWNIQPGDVLLDFECPKPKGRATFYGIWKVRKCHETNCINESNQACLCSVSSMNSRR